MRIRSLVSTITLTLLAGIAFAGLAQQASVDVDLVNMLALGDQLTARTSAGDTEFIGCAATSTVDGLGNASRFGFCQASDADGDEIICFTQNDALLDEMRANSAYAFISFSWKVDGSGGAECTRVRFSTQSFYLPDPNLKAKEK